MAAQTHLVSHLVRNPKDRFSRIAAPQYEDLVPMMFALQIIIEFSLSNYLHIKYGPFNLQFKQFCMYLMKHSGHSINEII